MARALIRMRKEMKTTIEKIRTGSGELYDAAQSMNKSASQTAESVEQVDKAISEIAQEQPPRHRRHRPLPRMLF